MSIEGSPVACGARTPKTFTLLRCRNRNRPADCFGEAHTDLRFDPNAIGTQAFGLYLTEFVADPADLFHLLSVEETQTYRGHFGPPPRNVRENVTNADAEDTQSSIWVPSVSDAESAGYRSNTGPGRQAGRLTGQLDARAPFLFRNPWLRNSPTARRMAWGKASDDATAANVGGAEGIRAFMRLRRDEPATCYHSHPPHPAPCGRSHH